MFRVRIKGEMYTRTLLYCLYMDTCLECFFANSPYYTDFITVLVFTMSCSFRRNTARLSASFQHQVHFSLSF